MRRLASEAFAWGLLLLAAVLPASRGAAGEESAETSLRLSPVELPEELSGAMDVRWSSTESLIVGVRDRGIYDWKPGARTARRIARSTSPPYDYGRVAYSGSGIVFSSALFGFFRLEEGRPVLRGGFMLVADLDRGESSSLVVGLRASASDNKADRYEGYLAWLVDDDGEPRGLVPTLDAGHGFDWCAGAELPVGRFISEDHVVVVPGAEAGAYVYDTNGHLVETLSVAELGVDEGCGVAREQMLALSNEDYATKWINQRSVVDEVVSDGTGAYWLFVRQVDQSRAKPVCWDLVERRLGQAHQLRRLPCIVSSDNLGARLRADLRGDRLFLLLSRGTAQAFVGTLNAARPKTNVRSAIDPSPED